ncbi:MAG: phosphoethanolamine--lipid A transferase EptA [Helicobacteraceae bacterium]
MRKFFATKYELGLASFIAALSLANLVLYHKPLIKYTLANVEISSASGVLTLLTVIVAQFGASVLILSLFGLLWSGFVRIFAYVMLLGNAVALYFMDTYGVILTKAMMGNVFNTNSSEAGELLSLKILAYIAVFGVLPALVLFKIRIKKTPYLRRVWLLLGTFAGIAAWGLANSATWLWIDKNAKNIGGLSLPWSYIINAAAYKIETMPRTPQKLLPPLRIGAPDKKQVSVLVIGEAARRANFSLYGYAKNTNPLLARAGVAVMPNATSCGTYTTKSIACMLSFKGSREGVFENNEPLPSYLKRFGVAVLWRTQNWGEPEIKTSSYKGGGEILKLCDKNCAELDYDNILLYKLKEEILARKENKIFVVLHQSGSHGPTYYKKYPPAFERFTPVCKTVDLAKCARESLVNAYDNTILYTDYLLAELISTLKDLNTSAVMLYASDHGESLGEDGFYLHGAPKAIAPAFQTQIPFLVWMSDDFKREHGLTNASIIKREAYSQDYIFHSVLGSFDATSAIYDAALDIFH